ncbi:MAG: UvrD-helicase domain-containing protein, partial [Anaerolineae bacterium]
MAELHPLVRQVDPSSEQCPAVTARGRDVVLTAGAGTGKTRTLVARYLDLLAEGVPVRRLVAITFTQKAREMRNRVRDELRTYLAREDLDADERSFWQERYVALDSARISTIHSLCSEILRRHPERLGIDPGFAVLTEGAMALLKQRAVEEALAWAADDAQAAIAFPKLGERVLQRALRTMLDDRLTADEIIEGLPEDLLRHWGDALAKEGQRAWERLQQDPDWRRSHRTLVDSRPLDPSDLMAIQRELVLTALDRMGGGDEVWDPAPLAALGRIDRRGGRQAAWPGGKQELRAVKDALKVFQDLWKARG